MVKTRSFYLLCMSLLILSAVVLGGCVPNSRNTALMYYRNGDPFMAEETFTPVLQEALEKDSKDAILYLWDMGMFRFAQGNYMGANEAFLKSNELLGYEPGAMETGIELLSSDASKRFLGDPVESSMAFLYVGLGFYMMGDYENALVGFKKSLEWDYSSDPERQGNMVITNMMMGECYSKSGESDQAVVAYRRVLQSQPDFIPAHVGICREIKKTGSSTHATEYFAELKTRVSGEYMDALEKQQGGVLLVIMSGSVPEVKDVGGFRKRKEREDPIFRWRVKSTGMNAYVDASVADKLLAHLQDQGGEGGQVTRKVAQVAASSVMEEVPILNLFAPSTDADVRYWSTLPASVFAAYVPLAPGLHTIRATAYDHNEAILKNYQQTWHYVPVREGETSVLVLISHRNLKNIM